MCKEKPVARDLHDYKRARLTAIEDPLASVKPVAVAGATRVGSTLTIRGGRKVKPTLASSRDAVSCEKCLLTRDARCVRTVSTVCARGPICDFRSVLCTLSLSPNRSAPV